MAHIYQPVMIRELLKSEGKASIRNIAAAFLSRDESQLEYYEQITKEMPGSGTVTHIV
jgi:ATP adenylyltransferase